jgi:hypothetical protein
MGGLHGRRLHGLRRVFLRVPEPGAIIVYKKEQNGSTP